MASPRSLWSDECTMNEKELTEKLSQYRERLRSDVVQAYAMRGSPYGRQRFEAWKRALGSFLKEELPSEESPFNNLFVHVGFVVFGNENDLERFWRQDGESAESFLDSLILDIKNGELSLLQDESERQDAPKSEQKMKRAVFIVHGHDERLKAPVARFLERLGIEAVILHEQANRGMTIIEKIERNTNVGFAVVLLTPDDLGNKESEAKEGRLNPRARQNVIFELGYLVAKLGRDKVIPLVNGDLEIPTDLSGIVYKTDKDWQLELAKELRAGGMEVDLNKAL